MAHVERLTPNVHQVGTEHLTSPAPRIYDHLYATAPLYLIRTHGVLIHVSTSF